MRDMKSKLSLAGGAQGPPGVPCTCAGVPDRDFVMRGYWDEQSLIRSIRLFAALLNSFLRGVSFCHLACRYGSLPASQRVTDKKLLIFCDVLF